MYKIKSKPEDFIVKEINNLNVKSNGKYAYFMLRKRFWSNLDAIEKIAKTIGVKSSTIGYAGNKDKWAVTEQYISVPALVKERMEKIVIDGMDLKFVGYGDERITLGSLIGNNFDIIVRNLDKKERLSIDYLENYFDEQRFGFSINTHKIGETIIKKNLKQACELIKINVDGNDYINALRKENRRKLRFYIHAYASWIWNKVAARYLKKNYKIDKKINVAGEELLFVKEDIENIDIPIIGYLMEINDKKLDDVYKKVMKEEKIKAKDFILKQIPELSSEGGNRKLFLKVEDFDYIYEKDEMNKGKYKARLMFALSKGGYATLVVKKLFA